MSKQGTFEQKSSYRSNNPSKLARTEQAGQKEAKPGLDSEGLRSHTEGRVQLSKAESQIPKSNSKDLACHETDVKEGRNSPVAHEPTEGSRQEDKMKAQSPLQQGPSLDQSAEEDNQNGEAEDGGKDDTMDTDGRHDISNEIEKLKEENEDLRKKIEKEKEEVEKRDRTVETMKGEIERLQLQIKGMKTEKEEKDKAMDQQITELETTYRGQPKHPSGPVHKTPEGDIIQRLQDLLLQVVQDSSLVEKQLKDAEDNLRLEEQRRQSSEDRVKELTLKLSQEMDAKISARESTIENVNIKNRPMKIKDDYLELCSNQWQDAKGEVDKFCDLEAVKLQLLCDIIMISYEEAQKAVQCLYDRISNPLGEKVEKESSEDEILRPKTLPQNLHTELSNYLKRSSDKITFVELEQSVFEHLNSKSQSEDDHTQPMAGVWITVKDSDAIKSYISSSCRLSWNMVIQRPPMEFTIDGIGEKWQGDKFQEPYWTSVEPDSEGAKVKCYVYPTLWQEDKLKTPGKVLIQKD